MTFEHVDIQWTVVSELSAQRLPALIEDRATAAGWTVVEAIFKDSDDEVLSSSVHWPAETFGSASFRTSESPTQHTLFWSTYTSSGLTKITGGLYINQYMGMSNDFRRACDRAFEELLTLFGGDDVSCVVLTLEDDSIDVAPGIIGCYRPSLWNATSGMALDGLEQMAKDGWVEVRPVLEPETVFVICDDARASLPAIQTALSAKLFSASRDRTEQ
jgi:hypothetical protein